MENSLFYQNKKRTFAIKCVANIKIKNLIAY